MDQGLLQVVVVIVFWAKGVKCYVRKCPLGICPFLDDLIKQNNTIWYDCISDRFYWSLVQRSVHSSRCQCGSKGHGTVS